MTGKLLGYGAEAKVWLTEEGVVKERIQKRYREPALDKELREGRMRREVKLQKKAEGIAPPIIREDAKTCTFIMRYIDGLLLEQILYADIKTVPIVFQNLGTQIGTLHNRTIVHGDLTTANVIVKGNDVVIIDFGLGFVSTKLEDYAVDLHVLKQGLFAKHPEIAQACWNAFVKGYGSFSQADGVLKRLEKVEQRGRYKRKHIP